MIPAKRCELSFAWELAGASILCYSVVIRSDDQKELFFFSFLVAVLVITNNAKRVGMEEESMSRDDDGHQCACGKKLTRRQFLTSAGAGALIVVASGHLGKEREASAAVIKSGEGNKIRLRINSKQFDMLVEPRWSLLYVLREELGFTGTKEGCSRGECGTCTVLIDNVPMYSCMTLAVEAEGREITTLEGLMKGEELGPVQKAFVEHDALQCGYCTPGQIMAVEGLLRKELYPTMEQIRQGVSGNLCRCGTYTHIFEAAKRAADLKRGGVL
jgi:xanthine dehydrogenase YagT iron-sulfur-binding subunit